MPKLRVRHAFAAILLLVAMLSQGTWALAGVTGGVSGYVRDSDGAPVAGAKVTVSSPSEVTSTTTDVSGHFSFLALAPDTYTISAIKEGYQETAQAGVTVFADQQQSLSLTMPKSLKTIASVRSQAASSLVKSGVGGDIYNVTPTQMQKTAALGGGGNLDSAYSAIASVPGLVVGTGGAGWNQAVVVRGNNPWTTGFEYDGIPVNRAFDNYTASTASNLGLQELQVYTGGGPSSISSTGTSGFINQVIKTGTYPGYGSLQGALSAVGAFYHEGRVEAGGASPNRNFSYYVGLNGYNQMFRPVDNSSAGTLLGTPGSVYATYSVNPTGTAYGNGVFNVCPAGGVFDPTTPAQGCLGMFSGAWNTMSYLTDRENVVNLHFGLPRHDGQRDDLQLMWSASAMQTYSLNNAGEGGMVNAFEIALNGRPYCDPAMTAPGCALLPANAHTSYPHYMDAYTYNLPFGTNIAPGGNVIAPSIYYQANTPTHSYLAPIPLNNSLNDVYNNDTGIAKLQWTHPLSSQSFVRLMGYSFFSDWTEDGAPSGYAYTAGWAVDSPNYDLITHTSGGILQYFNQINDKHLLQFNLNYTHSNVNRFNHTGAGSTGSFACTYRITRCPGSPVGLISKDASGNYHCYNTVSGAEVACWDPSAQIVRGAQGIAANGNTVPVIPAAASAAGAYWANLWNGNASGTFNQVRPDFYTSSIADQWRPSDKLTINASLRFDQFTYNLANPGLQDPYYSQIVQKYTCVNPSNNVVAVNPLLPGQYPPATPVFTPIGGACPAGYVHPDGVGGDPLFTLNFPKQYTLRYYEPRISGTFTQNPDTVWRFSAGRYAEPPLSAAVEYLYRGGSGVNLWTNFMALGTYSPFHPITGETSAQYDLSLEKRLHGTPMSFKITPFWSNTSNWEQQSFIGAGFVTQIPVGRARSYGVEAQFNYGDFNKQGLSGLVSFTYTKSQVQFQRLLGSNQIHDMNLAIQNFNALTKTGGGAACYQNNPNAATTNVSAFTPDPGCTVIAIDPATGLLTGAGTGNVIANPYLNMSPQGLLDENGWYDQGVLAQKPGVYTGSASWYNSPFVTNLVLNYRHDKFAITPSLQIQAGSVYGSPYDVVGIDPRNCSSNQAGTGVVAAGSATAQNCDYTTAGAGAAPYWTTLYVPNPQTGNFASYGQFRQPNIMVGNLQMSYDVSPKVTLTMTASDLFHTCFGGTSEPWTATYKPGSNNCGYTPNGVYNGAGWYNGPLANGAPQASFNNGVTPYGWEQQSYLPKFNNSIGAFIPFTLYVQAQVKL